MKRRVRLSVLLILSVACIAPLACSSPQKGSIILAVSTDMQVPKDFDIISIYVATDSEVKFDYLGRIQPDGSVPLPATLAIVEPDDPTSQVHIRITAFQDANPGANARVVRDVLTTVPHQRTVLLSIPLSFLDDGSGAGTLPAQYVPLGSGASSGTAREGPTQFDPTTVETPPACDFTQGLTSVYGQCVGALLDSSTLLAYDQAEAGTQAQGGGSCFDVTTCFAGATLVGDLHSCSFSLAQGVDASNLNLALATSSTGACIASLDECLVPLAEDPNAGWTASGGTVTLAPGACSKAQQVGVQLFQVTSGACPPKTLTTLVCEPTSPNGGESLPEGGDATVADAGDATVEVEAEAGFPDAGFDATVDGGMSCPTGQTLCGSACVKEQTDSNNCGSCGHYCQGGTCSGGKCQPFTLATMQTVPWSIAAQAGIVYWAERSANVQMLLSVPAGGGTISTLVSPLPGSPSSIALDSTHVYWGGSDTIMNVGLDGGTPQTLASGAGFAQCLAVDANNVYWTTLGSCPSDGGVCAPGSVFEVPLDGGTPFTLASGQLTPGSITVDPTHVYWVDYGNGTSNGAVMSVAIDGGGLVPLAQGLPTNYVLNGPEPDLNGIAVDSTGVYFTTWDGVSQGAVLKVPLTGGTPTTLATGTFPYGLAVNSSGVYFSDSKAGTILTAPLDGGVTVTIASGQLVPFAVAMDSTNVYWTNLGGAADGGAVLQVAKP